MKLTYLAALQGALWAEFLKARRAKVWRRP